AEVKSNAKTRKVKVRQVNGKTESGYQWVLTGSRRFHSHDVRAMVLNDSRQVNALVSGGVDVSLVVCPAAEFPNNNHRRLPYTPQKSVISISKSKRLLLCHQDNRVKLWR